MLADMEEESRFEKELGGALLASVSRSFYLTLKALPSVLREPISLAYLLARTADTIADTAAVPAETRIDMLQTFSGLVQGVNADARALAARLETEFRPLQTDPAEATLMQRLQDALAWLSTMHGARLTAVREVLGPIIHGQQLDIERFPSPSPLRSLQTAAELEEYTWLVAGCVGEFWTRLCFSEMPEAFVPETDEDEMTALGIRYGKGLQLVNILRDIQKDAHLGRCYLPAEQWRTLGVTEPHITSDPLVLRPVWEQWVTAAQEHLRCGVDYVTRIQHGRLRHATALPVLLGLRTLALLKQATNDELRAGIKVSRLEVGSIILKATVSSSAGGLAKLAERLAKPARGL